MSRFGILTLIILATLSPAVMAQAVKRSDLKPSLLLSVTDVEPNGGRLTRLEPTVGLTLASGEAPHPQSTGGQTFRWTGYINILLPGTYRFDAVVLGDLKVKVGDREVYAARATAADVAAAKQIDGTDVELEPGIQPFEATLTRTGPAVRVELLWSGPGFRPEPIPYFFFGHLPTQRPDDFATGIAREHGRLLFEEFSCVRCHQPAQDGAMAKTLTERTGPDLTEIGRRAYPGWLDAWLADPHALRPNTVMPKMFAETDAGKAERYAVVSYLASLGGPVPEPKPVDPRRVGKNIANGSKLYITAGCAACHGDKLTGPPTKYVNDDPDAPDEVVFQPEDYIYSLGTADPTGYYRLGHVGSKYTADGLAKYLQNPLATNPHGRMPNMILSGQDAQDIALFLVRQRDDDLDTELPKAPDIDPANVVPPEDAKVYAQLKPAEQWQAAGKVLLTAKGCINCHNVAPKGKALPKSPAMSLADVRSSPKSGCLAPTPDIGKVPVYAIDARQKAALGEFLTDGLTGPGSPAPAYHARTAIKRFSCLNCHNRDGEGGIDPALSEMMKTLENAENADDVQPPRLTGAGHKLRTPWLKKVLTEAGRARPWMTLRMPQYGTDNVGFLTHALPKLEGDVTDDAIGAATFTSEKVDAGRNLAGKSGFGCVACHDISGVTGGGTRGPDLASTNQRVRHDWYFRWMHQPQRMVPGTRMPQNFINGRSQIDRYYEGDADPQIDALWAYFSLGPGLPLPPGMEPPKGVVVTVKDRPELLRTFMPDDAGTKAIAVGYPGGLSLVFDAAQARIGYAWTGNFLDMTPVWTNRGGRPATLLGPKFWTAPAGHPWAVTDSRTPPDFVKRADDPAFGHQLPQDALYNGPRHVQFGGYSLDADGRPTFRYELTDPESGESVLSVAEKPTPLPVSVAAGVSRTFAIASPANKTVWFLAGESTGEPRVYGLAGEKRTLDLKAADSAEIAAAGNRVVLPQPGGRATVLQLTAGSEGAVWRFVPVKGGWQALLRLPESDKVSESTLSLAVWGLSRDDEALLAGLKVK